LNSTGVLSTRAVAVASAPARRLRRAGAGSIVVRKIWNNGLAIFFEKIRIRA